MDLYPVDAEVRDCVRRSSSGLGKGVTASRRSSLKSAGLNVTATKIDPYLNSDAEQWFV